MASIFLNDIEVDYEICGEGETLVLISGLGQSKQFWKPLKSHFCDNYQTLSFDNRGIGKSTNSISYYTIEQLANDTWSLISSLNINNVSFVGHSMGAAVAFECARLAPDRTNKLILASALYPGPRFAPGSPRATKTISSVGVKLRKVIEWNLRTATSPNFPENQRALFYQLIQEKLDSHDNPMTMSKQTIAASMYLRSDKLRRGFEKDLCLIYGEYDEITYPQNGYRIKERVPKAELHIIEDAGHLVPVEQKNQFITIVDNFLKK